MHFFNLGFYELDASVNLDFDLSLSCNIGHLKFNEWDHLPFGPRGEIDEQRQLKFTARRSIEDEQRREGVDK